MLVNKHKQGTSALQLSWSTR
eukprot:SAG31_NODE_5098_length_2745_cov_1.886999_3_plen_20_part_01